MTKPLSVPDSPTDDAELLRRLRSAEGLWNALQHAHGSELARQARLRAEFPNDLVRGALLLEELRARARTKFSRADRMWFDRVGLEQATGEEVGRHKARRFRGRVWDLCCGIGGDALALAERGEVVAVDRNEAQTLRAAWNAEAYDVGGSIETRVADVETLPFENELVHIDPDRRPAGRRSIRVEDAAPGLPFLESLMQRVPGGAIKLSPASNFPGKFPDAEIELISVRGECREATVWFGSLGEPGLFRATVLPTGESIAGRPLEWVSPVSNIQRFLYDPDPSVVRAGLVDMLGETLGLARLDAAEEYLTSETLAPSPFVQAFEVLADLPNNLREIRAHFRGANFGQLEVKCRHIPINADEVRRSLPLEGNEPGVLVFARVAGKARAVVCRRVPLSP